MNNTLLWNQVEYVHLLDFKFVKAYYSALLEQTYYT